MNEGLDDCHVGLVFFSSREAKGAWFGNEVSALICRRNDEGIRVIPVLIDDKVVVPGLLKPLARRSIDQFEQIVDAIQGVDRKPKVGPTTATRRLKRFTLRIANAGEGVIDLTARLDGEEVARETGVGLTAQLSRSYAEFIQGHTKVIDRGPAEAQHATLSRALVDLGDALGGVLFTESIGRTLSASLKDIGAAEGLELCFEAADPVLLALPFEAARLDGSAPALRSGVSVRPPSPSTRSRSSSA
ncbi:MAG: hypothetical protein FJ253_10875 [Phycisphaerae bacterium]|nr:hypothetical protein [Phycisphaerae bacterium]